MNPPDFFEELQRRNVYKVAVAYAVVAWLLLQAASILLPIFDAPGWVMKVFVLLVAAGWAFEMTPEGLKRTDEVSAQQSIAPTTGNRINVVIIAVLAAAVALLVYDRLRTRAGSEAREKSIAVLPFENFSDDKENAFFADGIQDDILTSLAKIRELKVISRTSVMGYRSGTRNLREIARALGVTNVLEGSVRRASDRVLVNVQLIDALTDRHVWADRYDRKIEDAIALQGELATEIAAALRATLSPEEKATIEKKPTDNAEAYTWYLKGLELETRPDISLEYYNQAEEFYGRAAALDPNFALAHAKLSSTVAVTYHEFDPTEERSRRARAEADESLRLNPNLGEGHIALAHWYYWIQGDYETALRELAVAEKFLPNSVDVPSSIAAIRRRQGRWRDALREYGRALSRDPRNGGIAQEETFTHFMIRDWAGSRVSADNLYAMAPTSASAAMFRAYVEIFERGEVDAARKIASTVSPRADADAVAVTNWQFAMIARDFKEAETAVAATHFERFDVPSGPAFPRAYLEGCIALARGDPDRGRVQFESARAEFQKQVDAHPTDASRYAALALVDGFLHRHDEAIREAQRAIELKPVRKDALLGALYEANLALVYAHTGETDKAMALIERLITTPGAVNFGEGSVTLQDLRLRWEWDPLRNDSRFQKIIAGPEPKTIYN
ncbi:MAG: hypothetical protein ACR2ID_05730 [Chthoniobacterales bacterium]